ncbi:restriction endonuclease subunit S [Micromonospora sp. NPDC005197]|uniref:restriction endonuclease subunit S n=1 Tax=Micromonospora sp. NPDC005197 TaxID=3157020 RepID=UPI0033ADD67F
MWRHSSIGQEFDIKAGITLGPHRAPRAGAAPYLRVANVQRGYINLSDVSHLQASKSEIVQYATQIDDLLIVEGHANPREIGRCSIVGPSSAGLLFQNHLFRLRSKSLHPKFALAWLNSEITKAYWRRMCATSSGLYTINSRQLNAMPIPVPPRREQFRIAEILDSADASISTTERLIENQTATFEAVHNDLLARGFEVDQLANRLALSPGAVVQTGPFGSQLHAHEYVRHGVPVVMPQDIAGGRIDDSGAARVTEARASMLSRHRLRAGDVVLARRGDLTKCAVVSPGQQGWLCGTGCLLLRPGVAVNSDWLAAMYRHDICQRQIAAVAVGSTMVNLNTGILLSLKIPWPSRQEQDRIADALRTHEQSIDRTRCERDKLRHLKQGLMEDLLTGRVRSVGEDVAS